MLHIVLYFDQKTFRLCYLPYFFFHRNHSLISLANFYRKPHPIGPILETIPPHDGTKSLLLLQSTWLKLICRICTASEKVLYPCIFFLLVVVCCELRTESYMQRCACSRWFCVSRRYSGKPLVSTALECRQPNPCEMEARIVMYAGW